MCTRALRVSWKHGSFLALGAVPLQKRCCADAGRPTLPEWLALAQPISTGPSSPVLSTYHHVIGSPACLGLPLLAQLREAPQEAALPQGGVRNQTAGKELSLFNHIQTVPLEGKDWCRARLRPFRIMSNAHFCPEVSAHHCIILTVGRAGEQAAIPLKNTYTEIKRSLKTTSLSKQAK